MIGRHVDEAAALDANTAERILIGAVAPDDAPPGYASVTALVRSLTAPGTAHELARERETVRAMAAVLTSGVSRPRRLGRTLVILGAVALLGGGSALAAVGVSHGHRAPASDRPTTVATTAGHHDGTSPVAPAVGDDAGPNDRGPQSSMGSATKGARISKLARETTASGVEKGAEISTAASGGKSQAGMHG